MPHIIVSMHRKLNIMNRTIFLLGCIILTTAVFCQEESEEDKYERITAELKLADWQLTDYHEGIAKIRKKVLLHKAKYTDE
ncbi:hypothetical protein Trydic_g21893, partial [Trypoxylus dichotomus]